MPPLNEEIDPELGFRTANSKAPLSHWRLIRSFDTARECEQEKEKQAKFWAGLAKGAMDEKKSLGLFGSSYSLYTNTICVPFDYLTRQGIQPKTESFP